MGGVKLLGVVCLFYFASWPGRLVLLLRRGFCMGKCGFACGEGFVWGCASRHLLNKMWLGRKVG